MSTHTLSTSGLPFALLWRRCRSFAARHQRPDPAALRDLGLDASEWWSVQAEAAGSAERTRRRIASPTPGGAA
jgi:hypothetical protein